MQAVEIPEAGPPDVLRLCTRPVPALQLGEVLIRVAAAGVNRPDCLQRAGGYPPPPPGGYPPPQTKGLDGLTPRQRSVHTPVYEVRWREEADSSAEL